MSTTVASGPVVAAARQRRRIVVRGLVQGVGFRPFVYAVAAELHLTGSVRNDSGGVVVEVEGDPANLDAMVARLRSDPPPLAIVEAVEVAEVATVAGTGFRIEPSDGHGPARTFAAPDVATCDECLADLADPSDRRFRHPFVSCTNCGPRFTIITGLPYDRPQTTMGDFPMCAACTGEYTNPTDRRFHAQPIACRDCGPRLELVDTDGVVSRGDDAVLVAARQRLAAGAVLAVKGLGGYHLVCDATNERAVATLRTRKRRGDKPFAVMVADLDTARRLVAIDVAEAALLASPARPIVLLPRDARPRLQLAPSVAPGSPDVGLLLPYTPLHTLLLGDPNESDSCLALVMTSGNLSGEPIITDDDAARELLAPMVDGWLRHDRRIEVPCDDSVSRVVDGLPLPIRRSRGYAPLPVALPTPVEATLAVGADLKNTCCVGEGGYAWLSQHVGDLDDVRSLAVLTATVEHLRLLTGVAADRVVGDAHPGYRSTAWAGRAAAAPLRVQHHHAHICSVLAEHGWPAGRPVLGLAFDGTGYGDDGAVWGGEALVADYAGYRRFAHLAYVPLPGGDAAVERPYRMALAHLWAADVDWADDLACVAHCPPAELAVLERQLSTGFGCVPTSSMGRLFDAVSAIAGVRQVADYEAQAAIELEGLARATMSASDRPGRASAYSFTVRPDGDDWQADPTPVIEAVARDALGGVPAGVIGVRFHAAVVALVTDLAGRARAELGLETVALSGGVFQNALLLEACCRSLRQQGFAVLRHQRVPPNDGGLALGQLMVAAHQTRQGSTPCV